MKVVLPLLDVLLLGCLIHGTEALNVGAYIAAAEALSTGAIVGIVIGAIFLVAVIIGITLYVWKGGNFMTFSQKRSRGGQKTRVDPIPQNQTTTIITTTSNPQPGYHSGPPPVVYPVDPPPMYSGPNQVVVDQNYQNHSSSQKPEYHQQDNARY